MASNPLSRANSIADLRLLARRRVPRFVFEYIDSGVEDEVTLHRNVDVQNDLVFVPRTLVNTQKRSIAAPLFGSLRQTPLIIAPTGFNGLAHLDGDVLLAQAAAAHGIPFTLSSFSNRTLEDVARLSATPPWLQLYVLQDFSITEALIERATATGCEALVLTTDANVQSLRERQRRCYRKPGTLTWSHMLESALHPGWLAGLARGGAPVFANFAPYLPRSQTSAAGGAHLVASQLLPTLSWSDVARIRASWRGKLLIKGILHPDDAVRAQDAGADGVVVSNHGGRQLEGVITGLDALPGIRRAVGPAYTVLVDGGFRRGGHVLKALALGATAVMLGRATLYGLAAGGKAGAERALSLLIAEIDRNLAMLGCSSVSEVTTDFLRLPQPLITERPYG